MANQPVRSISFPSREHPCSVRIEALLNHLKSFQFSPSIPYEFEIIQSSLVGLVELYNCVEEFMNSPSTQQALMPIAKHRKLVEQSLEGSIILLDTCNMARDILMSTKEHVQALQSALRRKGRGGDSSIESSIHAYLSFRKKAKKDMARCLGGLKRMEVNNNIISSPPLHVLSQDLTIIVKILRETSSITICVFWSLLKFLSMPTSCVTKANGWSLVAKLVRMKLLSFEKEEKNIVNLVGNVDVSLQTLLGNIPGNVQVKAAQKMLETLNLRSEGLVAELESMFRCLLQNRVSLLNILTQ